jgi:hypothetical protein
MKPRLTILDADQMRDMAIALRSLKDLGSALCPPYVAEKLDDAADLLDRLGTHMAIMREVSVIGLLVSADGERRALPRDEYGAFGVAYDTGDPAIMEAVAKACPSEFRGWHDAALEAASDGRLDMLKALLPLNTGEEDRILYRALEGGHAACASLVIARMTVLGKWEQAKEIIREQRDMDPVVAGEPIF